MRQAALGRKAGGALSRASSTSSQAEGEGAGPGLGQCCVNEQRLHWQACCCWGYRCLGMGQRTRRAARHELAAQAAEHAGGDDTADPLWRQNQPAPSKPCGGGAHRVGGRGSGCGCRQAGQWWAASTLRAMQKKGRWTWGYVAADQQSLSGQRVAAG
jgi:hypothetical protein